MYYLRDVTIALYFHPQTITLGKCWIFIPPSVLTQLSNNKGCSPYAGVYLWNFFSIYQGLIRASLVSWKRDLSMKSKPTLRIESEICTIVITNMITLITAIMKSCYNNWLLLSSLDFGELRWTSCSSAGVAHLGWPPAGQHLSPARGTQHQVHSTLRNNLTYESEGGQYEFMMLEGINIPWHKDDS